MTMPEHEPHLTPERALPASVETAFRAFDAVAPEGWHVELIEGAIHLVPPANGQHETMVSLLARQVYDHRRDLLVYTGIGLSLPGQAPRAKVVPDLVIAPKRVFNNAMEYHENVDAVLLVGEVTSRSTRGNDRERKARAYAGAGIGCYLLVDRDTQSVTLHTLPARGRYIRQESVPLGDKLPLPEPLGFVLDTGEFE